MFFNPPISASTIGFAFNLKICFLLGQHSVTPIITNQLFVANFIFDALFLSGIKNSGFKAVSIDKIGHQGN